MKKTIAIVVCVVVLLSCINIFAAGTTEDIILPQIGNNPQDLLTNGLVAFYDTGAGNFTYRVGSDIGVVAACFCYTINDITHIIVATELNTNYICWLQSNSLNDMNRYHYEPVDDNFDSSNNLYYNEIGSFQSYYNSNQNCYVAASLSDGLSTAKSYINSSTPITGNSFNYSLPAGNYIIIEVDSNFDMANISTTMPLQSTSFADNPWPNTTQRYAVYSTLPSSINPNSVGTVIPWTRTGSTTLFNITTSAAYVILDLLHQYNYVVIVNPYYYPAHDMDDSQYTNGSINIQAEGVVNFKVYNLTATVNTSTGAVENNINGTEWEGTIDPNSGDIIWTNQDNENQAPTQGGNLSSPTINGFQSWLQNAIQSIISIFEPAHSAITTLAHAVSNFAGWLYSLYIWLPSPVLSVLTSAITLAIIIGVIKVFI